MEMLLRGPGLIAAFLAFAASIIWCRGWIFRRRLKKQGRWLDWSEVVEKLRSREGCLIINRGNIPGRVWWTQQLTDDPVAYILVSSAFLTNCPIRFRSLKRIQLEFPAAQVIETHECVMS